MALSQGRQDPRPAREDHREPGRVPLDLRARGADLSLRHAAERRLRRSAAIHVRGHRRLHEHHAGRRLSRRRAAGGLLPARAHGRRRRGRAQDGSGRAPAEELHPEVRQRRTRPRSRVSYDSGNYGGALDKLLEMLDYKKFRAEQAAARKQGRLIGIGFSTYIEACRIAPSKVVGSLGAQAGLYESGKVRVHPDRQGDGATPARTRTGRGTRPRSRSWWPTSSASPWTTDRDRARRHRPRAVRHGHLRQPLGLGGRHRHRACRSTRSRRRARRSPPICWRPRRRTSSTSTASSR